MADDQIGIISNIGMHSYDQARFDTATKNLSRVNGGAKGLTRGQGEGLSKQKQEEIRKAATQFEGLLLQQMLKSMWATVPSEGVLGGSREEEYYRDMLNEGLAQDLAERQSIGIRDVIIRDLTRIEEKG